MANCVDARGLRKRYHDRVALDGVDLTIAEGRVVGVIGPNGSGKSTLLQALVGLLHVEGHLQVLGRDPWRERVALLQNTSFVGEASAVPRWLRVQQALEFISAVQPAFDRARAQALLDCTEIRPSDRIGELSKGMIAQFQLALAIGAQARLLVLDEPTLGLDLLYRTQFFERLLTHLADGTQTVVIATHEVEEIQHILTDLLFLDAGRVVLQCTAEQYEERFVEVQVHPDHMEVARGMGPIHERPAFGGRQLLFDGVDRHRLSLLGDLRRPSVAAVFAAVVSRSRSPLA